MPKVKPDLKRTLELHIRVSPTEKKIIDAKAKNHRSVAEYAREKLLKED